MASILHRNTQSHTWAGLENGDNSCYANAVIKALIPILVLRFLLETTVKSQGMHMAGRTRRQTSVVELFHEAIVAIESGSKTTAQQLVKDLKRLTIEKSKAGFQEDPTEYAMNAFGFILNQVSAYHRTEYDICSNSACPQYNQRFWRPPREEKGFVFLEIVENMSIFRQLERSVLGATVKGVQCSSCNQPTKSIGCSGIHEPPKLLPIVLRRNVGALKVLRTNVEVPQKGRFFGAEYHLVSAICHDGENVNNGHYWAHVVERDNSQTRHNDLIVERNKKIDGRKVYVLIYEQRQTPVTSLSSKPLLRGADDAKDGLNHPLDPSSKKEFKNAKQSGGDMRVETDSDGFITVSRKRKSKSTLENGKANSSAGTDGTISSGDGKHSWLKQGRGQTMNPSSSPAEADRLTSGESVQTPRVAPKTSVNSRVVDKDSAEPPSTSSARSKMKRAKAPESIQFSKLSVSKMEAPKNSAVASEASAKLSTAAKRVKPMESNSDNSTTTLSASIGSNSIHSSAKHEADSDNDVNWLLSLSKESVYGRFHFSTRNCDKFKVLTNTKSNHCQLCNKQMAEVPVLACKMHIDHVFCASCARHLADSTRKDSVLTGEDEYETDLTIGVEHLIRVSTVGAWLATTDVAAGIQFVLNEFRKVDILDMVLPHSAKALATTSRVRFHICPQFASHARHHLLWVFGRDLNGERILWWFDSLLDNFSGEALFNDLKIPLNITSRSRLIGERQSDDSSCGLFTVWAAGIIANVLCQNSQASCAEITPKLQEAFAQAKFDPENVRRFLQYSFRGLERTGEALIYLSDRSVEYPSLMIGDTHIDLLLAEQSKLLWFNNQMDIEVAPSATENAGPTDGSLGASLLELEKPEGDAGLSSEDFKDPAQMDREENRPNDADNNERDEISPVQVSLKGSEMAKVKETPLELPCPMPIEPPEGTSSGECLDILLKNVNLFPIEKYRALANDLLQLYTSWIDTLNNKDFQKFTDVLVNTHERMLHDGRELTQSSSIKFRKTQQPSRYISYACSCRYESDLKPIGGTEGKRQRNRVSYKTNCKRTASVSSKLVFAREHNCQPRPRGPKFQSVQAATKHISDQEEKSIMENLRHLITVLKLNKEQLRRQVLAQLGSRARLEIADHYIRLVREEIARQTDRSDPVNSFLEYLNREVDESQREIRAPYISLDGDLVLDKPMRLLQGVAYRAPHWAHPKNFFMFFVDGTDKLVLYDYICIPIFGLSQDFLLNLVAFVIAASESHSAFDLGLTVLARADPTLWRRQTIWMSDETAGLISALEGHNTRNGGHVRHLFCLLHKASNVEMPSGTVNLAPSEGGVSMDEAAKFEKEMQEAKDRYDRVQARLSFLPNRRKLQRDPVEGRKFSTWLNCYSCPANEDNDRRWTCWLSYMRPAPTREELLVRLDEFRRKTNAKLSYVISLYRTASRWALCMQEPSPDLGFGTNNPTEAAISRLKSLLGQPNCRYQKLLVSLTATTTFENLQREAPRLERVRVPFSPFEAGLETFLRL